MKTNRLVLLSHKPNNTQQKVSVKFNSCNLDSVSPWLMGFSNNVCAICFPQLYETAVAEKCCYYARSIKMHRTHPNATLWETGCSELWVLVYELCTSLELNLYVDTCISSHFYNSRPIALSFPLLQYTYSPVFLLSCLRALTPNIQNVFYYFFLKGCQEPEYRRMLSVKGTLSNSGHTSP